VQRLNRSRGFSRRFTRHKRTKQDYKVSRGAGCKKAESSPTSGQRWLAALEAPIAGVSGSQELDCGEERREKARANSRKCSPAVGTWRGDRNPAGGELGGRLGSQVRRCSGAGSSGGAQGQGAQGSRVPLYRGAGHGGAPGAHAQASAAACRGSRGLWPMGHAWAGAGRAFGLGPFQ
jgi:hypothetical protein